MKNRSLPFTAILFFSFAFFGLISVTPRPGETGFKQGDPDPPWYSDWGVAEGFTISVDTEGYNLPVGMAFVPDPGGDSKAPLYFVTELRGTIKVVSNDRTVHIFAEDLFAADGERSVEEFNDESGLTGICLDPQNGYVFVTYAYLAADNRLRNSIARFTTQPGTFALQPTAMADYPEVFRDFPTDASHQIGGCQVDGDFLYVGVGDGFHPERLPLGLDTPLGKVLRFTVDGQPASDNPFRENSDLANPANYVWALGFRNPFALDAVAGRVFVAENGGAIDRLVEIEPGRDYLWDGTDFSIGARADVVFTPSIAPVQLDFYAADRQFFPAEYTNNFFLSATGRAKGIFRAPYDFDQNAATGAPSQFLTYLGAAPSIYHGMVTALALGPDGLYFAPLLENRQGGTPVYKVTYDSQSEHPFREDDVSNPETLMITLGCQTCHTYDAKGGTLGPALDYLELIPRLTARLNSQEYLDSLDKIDSLTEEPFISTTAARQAVRDVRGETRVLVWIYNRLLEPKFDNPAAQMPDLGLTEEQAEAIARFLVTDPRPESGETPADTPEALAEEEPQTPPAKPTPAGSLLERIKTGLPTLRYRYLPFVFLAGVLLGVITIEAYSRRAKS